MENISFGHFDFSIGWKKQISLTLFNKQHKITLKLQAYSENDGITAEQEKALAEFKSSEKNNEQRIEKLLVSFDSQSDERFTPKTLLFSRDGSYALLCSDKQNLDDGIAVVLSPTEEIISQNDYL